MSAAVVNAIWSYLESRHGSEPGVEQLNAKLADARIGSTATHSLPAHPGDLTASLREIRSSVDRLLADIGDAIHEAGSDLEWRVDDGDYYPPGEGISDSYRFGNMHTVLAKGDDFAMGLFLLSPRVDYLDHRHKAPELYVNLSGGSSWRFDFGAWQDLPAGSVLWNEPGAVHATRTSDAPWLSVWAWLSDVDQQCQVVPVP